MLGMCQTVAPRVERIHGRAAVDGLGKQCVYVPVCWRIGEDNRQNLIAEQFDALLMCALALW